ncbi:MAG: NADH-quinone oxidoreductase subunit C [Microbacter sp.]
MDYNTLTEHLKAQFGTAIQEIDETADIFTIVVEADQIKPVIAFLKEQEHFDFLTDLCGIHYPDQPKELGVIYHLHCLKDRQRIRIKAFITKENPFIDSIVSLFLAANWMERETYDFYGIQFNGHPNLKRILNVEYLDYFPMRKDYPLEDATRTDKDDRFFGR